jgi:hypothetical protein
MIQPLINPAIVLTGQILSLEARQELLGISDKIKSLEAKHNSLDEIFLALQNKDQEQDRGIKENKDKNTEQDETIKNLNPQQEEEGNGVDI